MDVPAASDLEVIDGLRDGNVRSQPQAGAATDSRSFGSHSPHAGVGSLIWRASPFAIGQRHLTVTECNQQTVTNSLQYAHIADYGRLCR
jgi:hypothetical protein